MKANEKINENLTIVEYLAEGGFGKIYKGIYKKKGVERKVAVKLLEYSDEEKRNLV